MTLPTHSRNGEFSAKLRLGFLFLLRGFGDLRNGIHHGIHVHAHVHIVIGLLQFVGVDLPAWIVEPHVEVRHLIHERIRHSLCVRGEKHGLLGWWELTV